MYFCCDFPGTAEPVGVKNNSDGTYTVHYTPAQDGPYTVAVKYADQEVPHRYIYVYVLIKVLLYLAGFYKAAVQQIFSSNFSLLSD